MKKFAVWFTVLAMLLSAIEMRSASASAAVTVLSEGFESGTGSAFKLGAPYGSLTSSAGEKLAGAYSVKGSSASGQQWAEFLKLDAGKLALTPSKVYTISFKYRVVNPEPAGEFFYLYGKIDGTGETVGFNYNSAGQVVWRTEQLAADHVRLSGQGDERLAQMSFTANGSGNYAWVFGIHNGGTLLIDDIAVKEGGLEAPPAQPADTAATEGFERGQTVGTVWKTLNAGAVSNDADKRINGQYTVKATAGAAEEWREFLTSDPAKLKLAAGTEYTVTFKYKVFLAEPADGFFYLYAKSPSTGGMSGFNFSSGQDVLWRSADVPESGVQIVDRDGYKMARLTFKTGAAADYALTWGIRKGGGIAIDDVSVAKGSVPIHSSEQYRVGYANVADYGAIPDDDMDDTAAFKQAIAAGKSIFVPAGTYHVNETLQFQNQNLIGSGMFVSTIVARIADPKAPILKAGRSSVVADLNLGFDNGLVTNQEAEGDRVGIYTGAQWSLQRGSSVRNVRIQNVGTALYSPEGLGAESFSVTYDTLEIENFSYRGIDFRARNRTGNVFNNIYMNSNRPNIDVAFALTGEESETVINQLNVEHMKVNTAVLLDGVYALSASTVHIEGVTLRNADSGYVTVNNSSGSIGSLTVYYAPIEKNGVSIVRIGNNRYATGMTSFQPDTVGYLRIGTLHAKGLNENDPTSETHGAKVGGLTRADASGFVFFDRPANALGDYSVQLDNYVWYSYQNDRNVYEQFPVDPNGKISFMKLGALPLSGPTAKRPVNRMIANVTTYYDTDLKKLLIWNGTAWISIA
ncbi:glycosyl hydrolase family 28-related protein [Cohnella herbarum]|uniref:Rhamnogalacturonase A/B/Epimerase-like pectate lyase domain-containing protein n=1 Tax=Cohnella herbarum TaxID=2728023 RepID=A0A7Z2VN79_9BACL|nr:glycosyl hydrolase family 28-related protein [Cohnella herbarum]QJD86169.1 hypothetical protein HH215_25315 [Cohnella herbarum]